MSQPITYSGRSLYFNILFVLLNLVGLTFFVLGFQLHFEAFKVLFAVIGFALIAISSFFLFVFRGRLLIAGVARVVVGGLCIVSGLIKANDPIGFSYKLEEYFEDGALAYRIKELFSAPSFSLEFLIPYALGFSVIICIVEIVLGVMLIIGGKIKTVVYNVLLMMIFFTFLTAHTATCDGKKKFTDRDSYAMSDPMALLKMEEAKKNKEIKIVSKTADFLTVDEQRTPQCVTDCGCFGDALKGSVGRSLTPMESLWKDIVLVYLVIWIFLAQWIIVPNTRKENLFFSIASIALISFFSWVFGWGFPILFGSVVIVSALWILRAGKVFGNYGGSAFIVVLLSYLFIFFVLRYDSLKDYRPFAVGSDLRKNMNNGKEGLYESLLVYKNKKTGKIVEFSATSDAFKSITNWDNWKYLSSVTRTIRETRLPSISDFNPSINVADISDAELRISYIEKAIHEPTLPGLRILDIASDSRIEVLFSDYTLTDYPIESYTVQDTIEMEAAAVTEVDMTEFILKSKTILLLVSRNLKDADWEHVANLKNIHKECQQHNIPFILICTSSREEINQFRMKHDFNVPVFVNDEKTLKAVSRSNPTLLVVQSARVNAKFSSKTMPNFDWLNKNILRNK